MVYKFGNRNGTTYQGNWVNDKRDGNGIYYCANGDK